MRHRGIHNGQKSSPHAYLWPHTHLPVSIYNCPAFVYSNTLMKPERPHGCQSGSSGSHIRCQSGIESGGLQLNVRSNVYLADREFICPAFVLRLLRMFHRLPGICSECDYCWGRKYIHVYIYMYWSIYIYIYMCFCKSVFMRGNPQQ